MNQIRDILEIVNFGTKSPNLGRTIIFPKTQALTSYEKSEKTLEPILRKMCYTHTDGQTGGREFTDLVSYRKHLALAT